MEHGAKQMKPADLGRYAFGICVAVAMLAGCGGSQPLVGTPGAMPQTSAIATHAERGGSWMSPEATHDDLLYVSLGATVNVYSWRTFQQVGTLTGFAVAEGMCVDKAQDIYIVDYQGHSVKEFSHGGMTPIRGLGVPGGWPDACAIDPTTGRSEER